MRIMKEVFFVGDLVEPCGPGFGEHIIGVVTGIGTHRTIPGRCDIRWGGLKTLETWSPRELRLVSRAKNNNNEVKKANKEQD
jgi:hypothetical protein